MNIDLVHHERSRLARDDLASSVDTLHLVQRLSTIPNPLALKHRGFSSKPGKIPNSVIWFHNAPKGDHKPNLTIYENFTIGYGFRVNISLPKFLAGQNFDLPNEEGIFNTLNSVSEYVTDTSGIQFDALSASVARIDFATNLDLPSDDAGKFLERAARLDVPRMPLRRDLSRNRSVYRGNASRMIRIYDKSSQSGVEAPSNTRIRIEYEFPNEGATYRFAERITADNHRAETLLSRNVRMFAIKEVLDMLCLDSFEPLADYSFAYFYARTGKIDQARRNSSFVAAYREFGSDFYQREGSRMSEQRYRRELRECQSLGF